MRQILNMQLHLLTLFGIYMALVGAVKKEFGRESRTEQGSLQR